MGPPGPPPKRPKCTNLDDAPVLKADKAREISDEHDERLLIKRLKISMNMIQARAREKHRFYTTTLEYGKVGDLYIAELRKLGYEVTWEHIYETTGMLWWKKSELTRDIKITVEW